MKRSVVYGEAISRLAIASARLESYKTDTPSRVRHFELMRRGAKSVLNDFHSLFNFIFLPAVEKHSEAASFFFFLISKKQPAIS